MVYRLVYGVQPGVWCYRLVYGIQAGIWCTG